MAFVAPNFTCHAVVKPDTIMGLSSTNDSRLNREAHLCPCYLHQYQGIEGNSQLEEEKENSQSKLQITLNTIIRENGRKY